MGGRGEGAWWVGIYTEGIENTRTGCSASQWLNLIHL